jgi:ketosteroid isomerase-like protein
MSPTRTLLLTLLIACIALVGTHHPASAGEEGGMKAEVESAIGAFMTAYAARDLDAVMASFSTRDDVMIYGTGADEKRIGTAQLEAQIERDWAQSDAAAMTSEWMHVSGSGNVAWAAVDGAFDATIGDQKMHIPARMTMVLEKEKGSWKIVQAHFSMPAMSQEEGESF